VVSLKIIFLVSPVNAPDPVNQEDPSENLVLGGGRELQEAEFEMFMENKEDPDEQDENAHTIIHH
jgi:hypothetical protein